MACSSLKGRLSVIVLSRMRRHALSARTSFKRGHAVRNLAVFLLGALCCACLRRSGLGAPASVLLVLHDDALLPGSYQPIGKVLLRNGLYGRSNRNVRDIRL